MTDPSRPLACIPLRPSLRRYLAADHARRAEERRNHAARARTMAADMLDEWWRDTYLRTATESDTLAAHHEAAAVAWLAE
jgi:hypothetical protein